MQLFLLHFAPNLQFLVVSLLGFSPWFPRFSLFFLLLEGRGGVAEVAGAIVLLLLLLGHLELLLLLRSLPEDILVLELRLVGRESVLPLRNLLLLKIWDKLLTVVLILTLNLALHSSLS